MRSRETWRGIPGGSWIPAFAGMTASARNTAATLPAQAPPVIPARVSPALPARVSPVIPAQVSPVIPAQVSPVIPAKAGIHVGPRRRGIGASSGGFRILVLALAIVAAGGCGYQLRGAVSLPPGLDAIRIAAPTDLRNALVQLLDSGGVRVQPAGGSAGVLLRIGDERFDRRVLSVDPVTGKESEFELVYQVVFGVTGAEGEELVPKQTVSLIRDYVFDADAVLGKSREQSVLHAEMRRDAAAQIVRRIESSLGR